MNVKVIDISHKAVIITQLDLDKLVRKHLSSISGREMIRESLVAPVRLWKENWELNGGLYFKRMYETHRSFSAEIASNMANDLYDWEDYADRLLLFRLEGFNTIVGIYSVGRLEKE